MKRRARVRKTCDHCATSRVTVRTSFENMARSGGSARDTRRSSRRVAGAAPIATGAMLSLARTNALKYDALAMIAKIAKAIAAVMAILGASQKEPSRVMSVASDVPG